MALSRRTGQRFQASIWPGFVDAMTGILLVLMFVLTIFMIVQFVLSETISGQETELDALQLEVSALADALGLEKSDNANLETELGGLKSTLTEAETEVREQNALIAALSATRDAQEAALSAAQTRITNFEAQVAGLLAQRDTALGNVATLEGERDALVDQRDALTLALATARSEINVQVEQARLAAAQREAMDALIANLNRQVSENTTRMAALDQQVIDLEGQLSEEERRRVLEAAAAEVLRDRLENADAELTAMTLALEEQRRRAEETLTMLAAARDAREDLDLKLAAALLEGDTVSGDLAGALLKLAIAEASLAEQGRALAQADSALTGALSDKEDLAAQLARAVLALENAKQADATRAAELASVKAELTASLLGLKKGSATITELQAQLATAQAARARAEAQSGNTQSDLAALEAQLSQALAAKLAAENRATDAQNSGAGLQQALATLEERLAAAVAAQQDSATDLAAAEENGASLRARLASALAAKLAAEAKVRDAGDVERQLAAALAAKKAAEADVDGGLSAAAQREILLATAHEALAQEEARSAEGQRRVEVLNQQIAALRTQLGQLQALLDDFADRDAVAQVQLDTLGSDLNTALARAAAEERKRRRLEEAERKRLEAETLRLQAETKDLAQYRSEFFGRLRSVLGAQEGVRIVGDRFVFSSEVLFPPGGADLSVEGQADIAKVAEILQSVMDDIPAEINWIIRVDGHTDNVPIGGGVFADNWELSQARALSVVRYMIDAFDLPPTRLSANGFGEYQPVDTGNSPEALARNRRIELKFTEK